MSSFRFVASAARDLEEIVDLIADESGLARAESFRSDILHAVRCLAEMPGMGHAREDLTNRPVLFWAVHSYLVVYRRETAPLEVVRVVHGAQDPEAIREHLRDA